jgi:transcriptional regulator with XRE-family HTH domain
MSEWNHGLLVENIRGLLKHNNLTQQQLAEITEMTQANVSKALNPNDKRNFTLEQVIRISQHFGISIDELVGNKVPSEVATSPRAVLAFLSKLLCELKMRATDISAEELVYEQYLNEDNYPDCRRVNRTIKYPAFYFPAYVRPGDIAADEHEYDGETGFLIHQEGHEHDRDENRHEQNINYIYIVHFSTPFLANTIVQTQSTPNTNAVTAIGIR